MKSLTINIPEGFAIDTFDQTTGQIKFKSLPKKATERIKTVLDVLTDHGFTPEQFKQQCAGLEKDEVAYRIVKLLAKSLNEGWTPNWNDSNEVKYFPYFEMGGSSGFRVVDFDNWRSASTVGSRLCFKTREIAEYAGKQFTEVYKDFMTI